MCGLLACISCILLLLCCILIGRFYGVVAFEVVLCGILSVMYGTGSSVFYNAFAITKISQMGLYNVHMLMFL